MKRFKTSWFAALAMVMVLTTTSCSDLINDDLLDSPNSLSPENVDPNFLLNNIQLAARSVYSGASGLGMQMTRMTYMFGSTYDNAYSPPSFNGVYTNAYAGLFIDVQNLIPIAEERDLYFHLGIAKTLKAYAMLVLVDVYGDVPYSQALDPTNFNPGLDDDQTIYAEAIALLDEAIADFQNPNRRSIPAVDLYYDGLSGASKQDAWIRAANTFKLKAYLNTGNASAFNALVSGGQIISSDAYDFIFEYSSNEVNPDSRHPYYGGNYDSDAGDYMSIGYMNILLNDKADDGFDMDPRLRYFIYRQTTTDTQDFNENSCITEFPPAHFELDDPFCLLGDGWWGRDHLINDGIPPDGLLRSTWGVYPVGGQFDADYGVSVFRGMGYAGEGFEPIMMSNMTWFMVAEAALTLNNDPAAAKAALLTAIELSMGTVADFGGDQADGTGYEITDAGIALYLDVVGSRFDAASGTEGKLRLLAKEAYIATWGNGYEAYNMMRRTGYPDAVELQPARVPQPGDWYRSFLYPSAMVERNSSVNQKTDRTVGPFWDKGKGNFNF